MLSLDREELLLLFIGLVLMYIDRVHDNSTIKRHEIQLKTVAASELAHSLYTALCGRHEIEHWSWWSLYISLNVSHHALWISSGCYPRMHCIFPYNGGAASWQQEQPNESFLAFLLYCDLYWNLRGNHCFVFPSKLLRHKSCMFEWDNWMGRGDHFIEIVLSCLLKLLKWSFWTLSCPPDQTPCIGGSEIFDSLCEWFFFLFLTWRVFQQNSLNPPHEYIFHGSSHAQSDQIEERPWHDWPMCNCGPCPAWWQCHLHGCNH